MPRRPTRGSVDHRRTVEVEIVEDDDVAADSVLDALAAARSGPHRSPWVARENGRPGVGEQPLLSLERSRWGGWADESERTERTRDEEERPRKERHEEERPDRDVTGTTGRAVPWRGRGRRLAVVAALLALVVTVNVVQARQETARMAALATTPGILDPASEPFSEVWRRDGVGAVIATVDGLALLDRRSGSLEAVDGATGQVRWSRDPVQGAPVTSEHCIPLLPDGSISGYGTPTTLVLGDDALLLCLRTHRLVGEVEMPRVVVVEAADGDTRHAFADTGGVVTVEPTGDGFVLVSAALDGHLAAVRWDINTNEERWTFRSSEPIFGTGALNLQGIDRQDDLLVVQARRTAAIDLRTGREVDPPDGPVEVRWAESTPLGDGRRAVWRTRVDAQGDVTRSGHVEDADGTVLFRLPGPLARPAVHDGSVPTVLVSLSSSRSWLHGVDAETGQRLWARRTVELGEAILQVDGVMLVTRGAGVDAIDVRSGTVLWSQPVDPSVALGPATDGQVALLPESRDGTVLVARGLRNGIEAWRTPIPSDVTSMDVTPAGDLVLTTRKALIGLGPQADVAR